MFCNVSFLCICWYKNLILFLLLCFECSFVRVVLRRLLRLLFNKRANINCGNISNKQYLRTLKSDLGLTWRRQYTRPFQLSMVAEQSMKDDYIQVLQDQVTREGVGPANVYKYIYI